MKNRVRAVRSPDTFSGNRPRRSDRQGQRYGGRKPGTPNNLTQELRDAVIEAAERVGSDLRGRDGLVGYLMRVGKTDTKAFGALLRAVLPLNVNLESESQDEKTFSTLEECEAHFRQKEIPMPFWLPAWYKGKEKQLAEQLERDLSLEVKLLP